MIQDLPIADRPVRLLLISRKWFCDDPSCSLKVFTERYDWLAPHSRRTLRAEHILRQIAFSTSCLAAEKIAQAIHLLLLKSFFLRFLMKSIAKIRLNLQKIAIFY
ncbi:hypothetical protein P9213_08940 [Geobacillus stearothermophilus]|uniref:hypothetical protein n=1 Tax=Geobacillus stearothermophilus TaxID=1422 RepID=UPI002E219536|nr:hypothetical protein [Geobacillus stearothermophilus]MED4356772.1 hypothetical protein [Geobacillus stearothermophilus]